MDERAMHPVALAGALKFDFLCIHPFRDGNGRVSRLLWLLALYHCGYEVGRYISLERLIEDNKERYYEVLEESSRAWHEGRHNPWPVLNFLFYVLLQAYREFERRVGEISSPRGSKTELIERAVAAAGQTFTVQEIEQRCPGVSREMIQRVLGQLKAQGHIQPVTRGPGALWKKGNVS